MFVSKPKKKDYVIKKVKIVHKNYSKNNAHSWFWFTYTKIKKKMVSLSRL